MQEKELNLATASWFVGGFLGRPLAGFSPTGTYLLVTTMGNYVSFILRDISMFPKIVGFPPKSSILIGFSIVFTIQFGVPLFLETPIYVIYKL